MAALRHAEAMYPHASHVFLVSSASIPTKKADDLQPKEGQSITGAQCYGDFDPEQVWYDPNEWYTGPEFIQLASTHIETLIEVLHTVGTEAAADHNEKMEISKRGTLVPHGYNIVNGAPRGQKWVYAMMKKKGHRVNAHAG